MNQTPISTPFIHLALSELSLSSGTPLAQLPLLVLVGVTGVGKSTALGALAGLTQTTLTTRQFALLPDRREVTDAVMILPIAGGAVTDRQKRFELTAFYRLAHPGGMAQALGELCVGALPAETTLLFDGLRGLDEVRYAAEHYPKWRFVNLHAPDFVRLRRLLGRGDQFDRVSGHQTTHALRQELENIAGIGEVFTSAEMDDISGLERSGYAASDILAKTKIVVSERRNYDPVAAREYLLTLPPERVLDIDSAALDPAQIAAKLEAWL